MKTVEIKVKSCKTCPFSEKIMQDDVTIEQANCYAPREIHKGIYNIDDYYNSGRISKFCPLIENKLEISL